MPRLAQTARLNPIRRSSETPPGTHHQRRRTLHRDGFRTRARVYKEPHQWVVQWANNRGDEDEESQRRSSDGA
jgi:hypothetical protein